MRTKCLAALLIILTASSCSNKSYVALKENEYIVFGHFYGNCLGEDCVKLFKLTSHKLYEDRNKKYPSSERAYEGDFHEIGNAEFEKVKTLAGMIPAELLAEESHLIGAPDAADGGGIYFEYTVNGKKHFWLIDQVNENLPEYLVKFKSEINKKIKKLTK